MEFRVTSNELTRIVSHLFENVVLKSTNETMAIASLILRYNFWFEVELSHTFVFVALLVVFAPFVSDMVIIYLIKCWY